jgi:CYTH domain-containing protein
VLAVAVEIERKFQLANESWRTGVIQTYSLTDGLIARFGEGKIRYAGDHAWITV